MRERVPCTGNFVMTTSVSRGAICCDGSSEFSRLEGGSFEGSVAMADVPCRIPRRAMSSISRVQPRLSKMIS